MTREEAAKISTALKSKRTRTLGLAYLWLVLTITFGIGAILIHELRYRLGLGALFLLGINQTRSVFSTAAKIKKELVCESCCGLDTVLLDVTKKHYDTTEIRTHRTTHHSNDGDEIGYSETSYEAPTVRSYHSSLIYCNSCTKDFTRVAGSPVEDLVEREPVNPISLVAHGILFLIALVVVVNVMTGSIPLAAILAGFSRVLTHSSSLPTASAESRSAEELLTTSSQISLHGIGSVKIGMSFEEAMTASGRQLVRDEGSQNKSCYMASAKGLDGLSFMVHEDRVAVAYVTDKSFSTIRGARIGQDIQSVLTLYGGKLKGEVNSQGELGHVFTYILEDSGEKDLRLTFLSDGHVVGGIIVGKLPEIGYEEGCD